MFEANGSKLEGKVFRMPNRTWRGGVETATLDARGGAGLRHPNRRWEGLWGGRIEAGEEWVEAAESTL